MSDLEIFELEEKLAKMLNGDKEAIADVKKLYDKHPEIFKNKQEVIDVINEVAKEPKNITNAKRQGAILAKKKLQGQNKIGEIAVENDCGTNIIFHANKKNKDKQVSVEASSAKAAPTRLSRYADESNDLSRCNKALSIPANEIVAKPTKENNTKQIKKLNKNNKNNGRSI